MTDYPKQYETTALLRDGSSVFVRPIRADDADALVALHGRLSRQSMYYRFFSPIIRLTRDQLRHLVAVDYVDRMALVAERDEHIIGVGRYDRTKSTDHAEVAFTVEDAYQGRGVGTMLLDRLIEVARDRGIRVFEADVLTDNARMLRVFAHTGFQVVRKSESGVAHLMFRIDPTAEAVARAEERERAAVTSSLAPVIAPRSIAVIGASRHPGTIGHEIFRNLVVHGFQGPVYPINPNSPVITSVPAYPSLAKVPGPVDLAIIAVPASGVLSTVKECAEHGVKAVVVISAGFAETDSSGKAAQDELVRFVSSHGMRLVGPNCMGVINTDPAVCMNATFAPVWPPAGRVAMASQSGALGLAILDHFQSLGLGVSSFVALGNSADVSSNDLLQWWEEDPATSVVLLYHESFGNPRGFARLARRIAAHKPIVAVKSGRSAAGRRAASTHAAAAIAGSDEVIRGLFAQTGVIRTDTLEELFDVAALLAHQPLPPGDRVAILTNAGGPAVLAADACEANGLIVGPLADETQAALRGLLGSHAKVTNPVNMVAEATPDRYRGGLELLLADPLVDAVIVIYIPAVPTAARAVADAIVQGAAAAGPKPVLSCFLSARGVPDALRHGARPVPSYVFPESAALALAHAAHYGAWRRQPSGIIPDLSGLDRDEARRIVEEAERGLLPGPQAERLLGCYGIRVVPAVMATTAAEAVTAAEALGYPVVMKVDLPEVRDRRDVGGVALNLATGEAVTVAYQRMRETLHAQRVILQPMVAGGHEALVGVTSDPNFGPVVTFGLGSLSVELLRDVVFRITPITDRDARDMIRAARSFPLLEGWRGAPAGDVTALEELLLRVSAMVEDLPEIVEMDLSPVRVRPPGEGVTVLQARVNLKGVPR
jgi:acetyl coenzyme A synthetase (ADP forming)-like protein